MATLGWLDVAGPLIALSGWGKVAFDWVMGRPRIRGRVFNVVGGLMANPERQGEYLASFLAYLYLVNERRNSIHMLDYEMEVEVGGRWIPHWIPYWIPYWISKWIRKWIPNSTGKWLPKWILLRRAYGVHNAAKWDFSMDDGSRAEIENFAENLIYRQDAPVEYGKPLRGWVVFVGDSALHEADINSYRVRCIDAFQKRHVFRTRSDRFANIYLFQDMAGIHIPGGASAAVARRRGATGPAPG